MKIRGYQPDDYLVYKQLLLDSSLYGGEFDEARDGEARLAKKIQEDEDAILLAHIGDEIVGTVSLIDDGRVAMLFRFAVKNEDAGVVMALKDRALSILKRRGHKQVLVYSPVRTPKLDDRYTTMLEFNKGQDFTCYWVEL